MSKVLKLESDCKHDYKNGILSCVKEKCSYYRKTGTGEVLVKIFITIMQYGFTKEMRGNFLYSDDHKIQYLLDTRINSCLDYNKLTPDYFKENEKKYTRIEMNTKLKVDSSYITLRNFGKTTLKGFIFKNIIKPYFVIYGLCKIGFQKNGQIDRPDIELLNITHIFKRDLRIIDVVYILAMELKVRRMLSKKDAENAGPMTLFEKSNLNEKKKVEIRKCMVKSNYSEKEKDYMLLFIPKIYFEMIQKGKKLDDDLCLKKEDFIKLYMNILYFGEKWLFTKYILDFEDIVETNLIESKKNILIGDLRMADWNLLEKIKPDYSLIKNYGEVMLTVCNKVTNMMIKSGSTVFFMTRSIVLSILEKCKSKTTYDQYNIDDFLEKMFQEKVFVKLDSLGKPFYVTTELLYLRSNSICGFIKRDFIDEKKELYFEKFKKGLKKNGRYQMEGVSLNDEQTKVLFASIFLKNLCVIGLPGTGKTLTIKCLYDFYSSYFTVAVLTRNGSMSNELKKRGISNSKTIHMFIRSFESEKRKMDCDKIEMVIIDEFSNVTDEMFFFLTRRKLFPKLKRMIMVYDPLQIGPIGPGRLSYDFINCFDKVEDLYGALKEECMFINWEILFKSINTERNRDIVGGLILLKEKKRYLTESIISKNDDLLISESKLSFEWNDDDYKNIILQDIPMLNDNYLQKIKEESFFTKEVIKYPKFYEVVRMCVESKSNKDYQILSFTNKTSNIMNSICKQYKLNRKSGGSEDAFLNIPFKKQDRVIFRTNIYKKEIKFDFIQSIEDFVGLIDQFFTLRSTKNHPSIEKMLNMKIIKDSYELFELENQRMILNFRKITNGTSIFFKKLIHFNYGKLSVGELDSYFTEYGVKMNVDLKKICQGIIYLDTHRFIHINEKYIRKLDTMLDMGYLKKYIGSKSFLGDDNNEMMSCFISNIKIDCDKDVVRLDKNLNHYADIQKKNKLYPIILDDENNMFVIGSEYISLKDIQYGWCMTVDSSQGKEFDEVSVIGLKEDRLKTNIFGKNHLHVLFTRAKKKFTFIGDTTDIECMRKNNISDIRNRESMVDISLRKL